MIAKKSKWFWWSFLPFFNFAAWIHVAVRTGRNSYYWYAVIYGIPFLIAMMLGAAEEELKLDKGTINHLNDVMGGTAMVLWIGGMIHALLKKDSIDHQINSYDVGGMQALQVSSNPLPSSSNVNLAAPILQTVKTFKYIDGQGNMVGPASLESLRTLKQAGVVSGNTQIIDEDSKRSFLLEQLMAEARLPETVQDRPQCPIQPLVPLPPPPMPTLQTACLPARDVEKPWFKTWWGICIIVFGCLFAIGKLSDMGGYGKFYYSDARVLDELELSGGSIRITRVFKMDSGGESQSGSYKTEKTEGDVVYMTADTKQYVGGMEIPSRYVLAYDKKADTVLLKMVTSEEAAKAIKEMGLSDSRLFERKNKVIKE